MSNISLSFIKYELTLTAFLRLPIPTLFPQRCLKEIANTISGEVKIVYYLIREEGDKNVLDVCLRTI